MECQDRMGFCLRIKNAMIKLTEKHKNSIIAGLKNTDNMKFNVVFVIKGTNKNVYPYSRCLDDNSEIIFLDSDMNFVHKDDVDCYINLVNTCYYKITLDSNHVWIGQYAIGKDRNGFTNIVRILFANNNDNLEKEEFNYLVGFSEYISIDDIDEEKIKGIKLVTEEEMDMYSTFKTRVKRLW